MLTSKGIIDYDQQKLKRISLFDILKTIDLHILSSKKFIVHNLTFPSFSFPVKHSKPLSLKHSK